VPTADSAFKVGAPRRRLGRWPHGPARPSPHLPASASRSRCARSPDRLLRGGSRLPGVDVGPCEAGSPARHHPQHWDQPGSIDGIEHQTAGQGPSPCQNLPLSRVSSVVPRHRAGQRLAPSPTGKRHCGARALCPDVVTIVRTDRIGAGGRERRPGGHRARHGRLDHSSDRLRQTGTEIVHTRAPFRCERRKCGRMGPSGESRRSV
jgi:hypothetical protein